MVALRVSIAVVIFLCILSPWTAPKAASVTFINKARSDKVVLFIHGIFGDPLSTFKDESSPGSKSWPELMASDNDHLSGSPPMSEYSTAVVRYDAARDSQLSVEQIANQLKTDLKDGGVFDKKYKDIFIIAHSMGGLVVKRMIIDMTLMNDSDLKKIRAVLLFSTPSQGAPAANVVQQLIPKIFSTGRAIVDLQTIDANTFLQTLEAQWQTVFDSKRDDFPKIYCAYETQSLYGIVVVPQAYTATRCDNIPRAWNRNHTNIVKPIDRSDEVYIWARGRIIESLNASSKRASDSSIELVSVDLEEGEGDELPLVNVNIRSIGKQSVFVHAAEFRVQNAWVIESDAEFAAIPSSASYDIVVPVRENASYSVRTNKVRQGVAGADQGLAALDRFSFRVKVDCPPYGSVGGNPWLCVIAMKVALIYNAEGKEVVSREIFVTSKGSVRRLAATGGIDSLLSPNTATHNRVAVSSIKSIDAVRSKSLDELISDISALEGAKLSADFDALISNAGKDFSALQWVPQEAPSDVTLYGVKFIDPDVGVIVGEKGLILSTSNGGVTWDRRDAHVNDSLYRVQLLDEGNWWVVGENGCVLHTEDGGVSWEKIEAEIRGAAQGLHFVSAKVGWIVSSEGNIKKTSDGGKSWTDQGSNGLKGLAAVWFVDARAGWIASTSGSLLKTVDGGATWEQLHPDSEGQLVNAVQFVNRQIGWIGGKVLLKTVDGGKTWKKQIPEVSEPLRIVFFRELENYVPTVNIGAMDFLDSAFGWVAGYRAARFKPAIAGTADGGEHWAGGAIGGDRPGHQLMGISIVDPELAWTVGEQGMLFKSHRIAIDFSTVGTLAAEGVIAIDRATELIEAASEFETSLRSDYKDKLNKLRAEYVNRILNP